MLDLEKMDPLKRHWITKNANIPIRYMTLDFDKIKTDTRQVPEAMTSWMDDLLSGNIIMNVGGIGLAGRGLLFDGAPGRGKTTHAVAALNEFVMGLPTDADEARKILKVHPGTYGHNIRPVYYMTFTDFLYRSKAMFDADPEDRRRLQLEMDGLYGRSTEDRYNVRLLVLDDLGKEYGSKYDKYAFDDILRARYDKGLPTIITTNIPLTKWDEEYSEAMGSFAHEAFIRIKLSGGDIRRSSE